METRVKGLRIDFNEYIFPVAFHIGMYSFLFAMTGSFAILIYAGWLSIEAILFSVLFGASVGAGTGAFFTWRRADLYEDVLWKQMEFIEKEYAELHGRSQPIVAQHPIIEIRPATIKTQQGTATIYQPKAGEFANWLRASLQGQVLLSRRESLKREWTEEQYSTMVTQLRAIGWLHAIELNNGTPVFVESKKEEIKAWLGKS